MRVEYLAELADLAETLSYAETAERNLLSESSLSRHIKALEDELGVTLFERTSRRVRLTRQGEQLLPYARQIRQLWSEYQHALRDSKSADRASVTIASNYYIGDLVSAFCAHHPDVAVRQLAQDNTSAQLLSLVGRGECQFAVAIDPPPTDEVDSIIITVDSYVAVLPESHPLAGAESISPAQLAGDHFISFKVDTEGDRKIRDICRGAGFQPNIIFSADVGSAIAQFVKDGLGVTFLQSNTIAKMDPRGVVCVALEPPTQISVRLCWKARTPLPAPALAFLTYVRAQLPTYRSRLA
ncbi:MAG: LysR family transcriptional regulator [Propionicimonas sp.]|uniref:LysR family transcriptional regulator n=1 Tax=Propionicimonas sp. TaxID=1955623 RepID=UPI003D0FA5D7